MKFEFSAGGIVFRPIRQAQGKKTFEILVAQHSQHHGWVFPKGLIGDSVKGEKKETTAAREVEEETGVKAKIIVPLKPVTYWYQFKDEKIKKTVYYFIMEYISGDISKHDWEMENVEWIDPSQVEDKLTYKSDKMVWRDAKAVIPNLFRDLSHKDPESSSG